MDVEHRVVGSRSFADSGEQQGLLTAIVRYLEGYRLNTPNAEYLLWAGSAVVSSTAHSVVTVKCFGWDSNPKTCSKVNCFINRRGA